MAMVRKPQRKKNKQFNFLIDSRGLFFVSTLVLGCFVLAFYIGYQLGKSQRMPEEFQQVVKQVEPAPSEKVNEENFAVFNLKEKPPESNLSQKIDQISKEIDQEKKQAKESKPASTEKKATSGNTEKSGSNPEEKTVPDTAGKTYTVQIAAISDFNRADNYVKALRKKNFDSYLQTISDDEERVIYRVRVGKVPYEEAQKILTDLKPVLDGVEPTVVEVK